MALPSTTSVIRRKLRRLWMSPSVLLPTALGTVGLAVHGIPPDGLFSWGLAAAILFGVGNAVYRWFARGPQLTEQAYRDLREAARREHHRHLNQLRSAMRADRDPRTSQLVRQLQQMYDRATPNDPRYLASESGMTATLRELFAQFNELYASTLALLEKSLGMWQTARGMSTESARNQMLESREKLIQEVTESVKNLELTLDRLQTSQFELRDLGDAENARLREELQRNLDVSRQIERRLDELEHDLRQRES